MELNFNQETLDQILQIRCSETLDYNHTYFTNMMNQEATDNSMKRKLEYSDLHPNKKMKLEIYVDADLSNCSDKISIGLSVSSQPCMLGSQKAAPNGTSDCWI